MTFVERRKPPLTRCASERARLGTRPTVDCRPEIITRKMVSPGGVMATLYDLPESRQRNFLWLLASRFRLATDLGFDPRATTFGSELRVSLVDDAWIELSWSHPCRTVIPDSFLWRHYATDDPARPFGPTMGDLLDGAPMPESRLCAMLSTETWSASPAAQAAFALRGRPSEEFTKTESARLEDWRERAEGYIEKVRHRGILGPPRPGGRRIGTGPTPTATSCAAMMLSRSRAPSICYQSLTPTAAPTRPTSGRRR
ncbi:hypothetical protein BJ970_004943 [Saccharopolyspora phatthalungensis]|uniref:Uncharacterized protein n=1 Tax=Saccharopolyspora phatthalungensis TaxID=664693 RepID=A0A840QFN2_9PSEU|nr:hypothetical protein [Saccharopolyspora phatthalungensis]